MRSEKYGENTLWRDSFSLGLLIPYPFRNKFESTQLGAAVTNRDICASAIRLRIYAGLCIYLEPRRYIEFARHHAVMEKSRQNLTSGGSG